jgi:hypothetical protein
MVTEVTTPCASARGSSTRGTKKERAESRKAVVFIVVD